MNASACAAVRMPSPVFELQHPASTRQSAVPGPSNVLVGGHDLHAVRFGMQREHFKHQQAAARPSRLRNTEMSHVPQCRESVE